MPIEIQFSEFLPYQFTSIQVFVLLSSGHIDKLVFGQEIFYTRITMHVSVGVCKDCYLRIKLIA